MKMKPTLPSLLAVAVLASALPANAEPVPIPFSDANAPRIFRAIVVNGELSIRGTDTDVVTIDSDIEDTDSRSRRADGLRVIGSSSTYSLTEADNVVTLDYGQLGSGGHGEFDVTLPRNTTLELEISIGGEMRVSDIDGDVSIKNLNGEISLTNLGGGAIIESMNGEIEASFRQVLPDKPLSFTSMNGEIKVSIPADTSANVRFRTQNGTILTDFDEDELATKTEPGRAFSPDMRSELSQAAREIAQEAAEIAREVAVEVQAAVRVARAERSGDNYAPEAPRAPRAPRPPSIPTHTGGKVISGALNGGGTDLQIATMNGDIVLRKIESDDD